MASFPCICLSRPRASRQPIPSSPVPLPGHHGRDRATWRSSHTQAWTAEPKAHVGCLEFRGSFKSLHTLFLSLILAWLCLLAPVAVICYLNLFDSSIFLFLKKRLSQFPILPFSHMPLHGRTAEIKKIVAGRNRRTRLRRTYVCGGSQV